jgi:hypothetical protein
MAKPDFPLAIALESNLLVEQGNFKEAAASLNPAVAAHPVSAELLNSAGLLALAQKEIPLRLTLLAAWLSSPITSTQP